MHINFPNTIDGQSCEQSHDAVFMFWYRQFARVKATKRNPTFWTGSLRNPDVILVIVQPKLTIVTLSDIWKRQKRI